MYIQVIQISGVVNISVSGNFSALYSNNSIKREEKIGISGKAVAGGSPYTDLLRGVIPAVDAVKGIGKQVCNFRKIFRAKTSKYHNEVPSVMFFTE